MKYLVIEGVIGSTSLVTHAATNETGTTWYNIKGSNIINMTDDEIYDGINVRIIRDDARYNHDSIIESLDDFVKALNRLHGTNN